MLKLPYLFFINLNVLFLISSITSPERISGVGASPITTREPETHKDTFEDLRYLGVRYVSEVIFLVTVNVISTFLLMNMHYRTKQRNTTNWGSQLSRQRHSRLEKEPIFHRGSICCHLRAVCPRTVRTER